MLSSSCLRYKKKILWKLALLIEIRNHSVLFNILKINKLFISFYGIYLIQKCMYNIKPRHRIKKLLWKLALLIEIRNLSVLFNILKINKLFISFYGIYLIQKCMYNIKPRHRIKKLLWKHALLIEIRNHSVIFNILKINKLFISFYGIYLIQKCMYNINNRHRIKKLL